MIVIYSREITKSDLPSVVCKMTMCPMFEHNETYTTGIFIWATTMENTCQVGARKKEAMSPLAHLGRKITIEQWREERRLAKGAIREMSLSEWSCFMKKLYLVQKNTSTTAYIIFKLEQLHRFYLDSSRLSKECTSTHLWSDATRTHPYKTVQKRTPLMGCIRLFYYLWASYLLPWNQIPAFQGFVYTFCTESRHCSWTILLEVWGLRNVGRRGSSSFWHSIFYFVRIHQSIGWIDEIFKDA